MSNMYFANEMNFCIMNGRRRMQTTPMAIIFGTNVSVISFMEVAAWKIEIIRPTTIETNSIGADTINIV